MGNVKRVKGKGGGFTLIEILIVVMILAILASIVSSKISNHSDEARLVTLTNNLRTVRVQLEAYRVRHQNQYPPVVGGELCRLTTRTKTDGTIDPNGPWGPYLPCIPENPFNGKDNVKVEAAAVGIGDNSYGWHYNPVTGEFRPSDEDHVGL